MKDYYQDFLIRNWEQSDRTPASEVIHSVLSEYGLGWEPNGADRDVLQVEECYLGLAEKVIKNNLRVDELFKQGQR